MKKNIPGIIDNLGGSFKDYCLINNMPEKIADLKKNLDIKSIECIDKILFRMLHFPDQLIASYYTVDFYPFLEKFASEEEKFFQKNYADSIEEFKMSYKIDEDWFTADVFLFHHGLAFRNSKIKEYIRGTTFIDCGAYIGDSALVLIKHYFPLKILSFEISKNTIKRYKNTMNNNDISIDMYEIFNFGVSNHNNRQIEFDDTASPDTTICGDIERPMNLSTVECISVDSLGLDAKIGFIKVDVEGAGIEALLGMEQIIQRDRPILSLSIYHNPKEFFEMKPLLEEITAGLGYIIEVRHYHPFIEYMVEVVLFAYPKELSMSIEEEVCDFFTTNKIGKEIYSLYK